MCVACCVITQRPLIPSSTKIVKPACFRKHAYFFASLQAGPSCASSSCDREAYQCWSAEEKRRDERRPVYKTRFLVEISIYSRKDACTEHPVARSPSPGNRPRVSKAEPARQQSGARFSAAEALPLSQGEHLSERPFTKPDLAAPAHGTPAGATGQGLVALVCVPGERGRRDLVHDLGACGGCGVGSGGGDRGYAKRLDWDSCLALRGHAGTGSRDGGRGDLRPSCSPLCLTEVSSLKAVVSPGGGGWCVGRQCRPSPCS